MIAVPNKKTLFSDVSLSVSPTLSYIPISSFFALGAWIIIESLLKS